MKTKKLHVRFWISITVAASLAASPVLSDPLHPGSFASMGPGPFTTQGTYQIDTSSTPPSLTGPATAVSGVVSGDLAVFVFDSIAIPQGVAIVATGSRPLVLLSKGAFQLSGGSIDGSAATLAPGPGGAAAGSGLGRGSAGRASFTGGGGAGFGTSGGNGGGAGAPGGQVYGNLATFLEGGSGGGTVSAASTGGPGGGAIEIGATTTLDILGGAIAVDGAAGIGGFDGGGGGGSGGGILLHAPSVNLAGGSLSARGGDGGGVLAPVTYGGGGGAMGRIAVLTSSGTATIGSVFVALAGGNGGSIGGQAASPGPGAISLGVLPAPPPPPPAIAGCLDLSGVAAAGLTVKLKQRGDQQQAITGSDGCFVFATAVPNRTGTITIELPPLP